MIIDTHAHYDDPAFDEDREELLASMSDAGVGMIFNIGASVATSQTSVDLAHSHSFIKAAVGLHPEEFDDLTDECLSLISDMIKEDRRSETPVIRALGEIGLDYHWAENEEQRALQREFFIKQLALAREHDLPVMIHSREAAEDTISIIREYGSGLICDIHCYSGSPEMALEYVSLGHYIGVGGVVTFKNGKRLKETVRQIPMDRILLETDCPYMSPEPHRGERNDSRNIKYVIQQIAELRGITPEETERICEENARAFYRL